MIIVFVMWYLVLFTQECVLKWNFLAKEYFKTFNGQDSG